jgi:hypothetical protein
MANGIEIVKYLPSPILIIDLKQTLKINVPKVYPKNIEMFREGLKNVIWDCDLSWYVVPEEFFELGRQIIKNPLEFNNLFLTNYKPKVVGTDEAFSLSAKILDITDLISYDLEFPRVVHMKPLVQNWPWPADKWSDHIGIYINKQGKVKIGNYQQQDIVHYVEKDRINLEIVNILEELVWKK